MITFPLHYGCKINKYIIKKETASEHFLLKNDFSFSKKQQITYFFISLQPIKQSNVENTH